MFFHHTKHRQTNYFFSSPVIVDNIVYYLDSSGNIIARKIDNLKDILWKTKIIENNSTINYFGGKISFYNNTLFISASGQNVFDVFHRFLEQKRKAGN